MAIRIHIGRDPVARAQALQCLEGGMERSAADVATAWGLDSDTEALVVLEQLRREGLVVRVRRPLDTAYALVAHGDAGVA